MYSKNGWVMYSQTIYTDMILYLPLQIYEFMLQNSYAVGKLRSAPQFIYLTLPR